MSFIVSLQHFFALKSSAPWLLSNIQFISSVFRLWVRIVKLRRMFAYFSLLFFLPFPCIVIMHRYAIFMGLLVTGPGRGGTDAFEEGCVFVA